MVMGRRFRAALQHKIISNLPLIKSTHKKKKKKTGKRERVSKEGVVERRRKTEKEDGEEVRGNTTVDLWLQLLIFHI